LAIICARWGWTKELDINFEPKHLGKKNVPQFLCKISWNWC
jgi:hypothetical protein